MKMLYLTHLTAALLLLIAPRVAMAQTVEISDPGLRAVIRKTLNKPSGNLTVADMESLTVLDASRGRRGAAAPVIRSLEGLQAARNLTVLNLSGGNLIPGCVTNIITDDYSPLQGLSNLKALFL